MSIKEERMPRPRKGKNVCCVPRINHFGPLNENAYEEVVMTVEEFETIRLIDYENMIQEECAQQMNVARTTVQALYEAARKKISIALVEGKRLIISGGDYVICSGIGKRCGRCRRMNSLEGGQNDDYSHTNK